MSKFLNLIYFLSFYVSQTDVVWLDNFTKVKSYKN